MSQVWRLDYWFQFDLCLQCDGLIIGPHSTCVFSVTTWLLTPIRLASSVWRLDYWFPFDLCLQRDDLIIDSPSTCVFSVTTWLLIPVRLVASVWRLDCLLLDCVFKIDLGVVNLYRQKIRPSVVVFLHGTGHLFVTDVSFIWSTCVFNNTVKYHRPRHTRANKFKLKKFLAGEYRHNDDSRNLRYTVTLSLQAHSNIFKSPQISCNSLFALLS